MKKAKCLVVSISEIDNLQKTIILPFQKNRKKKNAIEDKSKPGIVFLYVMMITNYRYLRWSGLITILLPI